MIGDIALRGYRRHDDSKCCCDRARFSQSWYGYEVSRISGWINLLKKMEVKTTTDVVAVYLIATRQSDLLYPLIEGSCRSLDREITLPGYSFARRTTDRGNRVLQNYNFGGCYCFGSHDVSETAVFPIELFKMAHNWLISRVNAFIEVITSAICESGGLYSLSLSTRLPKRVITALEGFTPTSTSTNSIVSHVKALYATLMPAAMYEASYSSNVTKDRFPSIRWNPTMRTDVVTNEDDTNYERISISVRNKFSDLQSILSALAGELKIAPMREERDIPMDEKEAFCLVADMLLYITALARSYNGTSSMHYPRVDDANKFFFVDKVDENGYVHKDREDVKLDPGLNRLHSLTHLSPAAAICIADGITDRYACYCSYFNDNVVQFLEKAVPNPYGEVMSFLVNEYWYQQRAKEFSDTMKKNRLGLSEGGCHA